MDCIDKFFWNYSVSFFSMSKEEEKILAICDQFVAVSFRFLKLNSELSGLAGCGARVPEAAG